MNKKQIEIRWKRHNEKRQWKKETEKEIIERGKEEHPKTGCSSPMLK